MAAGEGAMTRHWHSVRAAMAIVGLSRLFRRSWRVLACCALVAHPLAFAQAEAVSLFDTEPRARAVAAAGVADESTPHERPRVGRVEPGRFDSLRNELISGRRAKLRLNLFENANFEATFERSSETASGYTLSGPLRGMPFGHAVLVVNDGVTMGRVYTPEGNYSMRGQGNYLTVERMTPHRLRCETLMQPTAADGSDGGGILTHRKSQPIAGFRPARPGGDAADRASAETSDASTASGSDGADGGNVVDVLVVYPSFARDLEGGYGAMLSIIDLDIATANEAYAASGVELRINLAAAVEIDYGRFLEGWFEQAPLTIHHDRWRNALTHLADRGDGYLDDVHSLRDRYAADLVLLHLGGEAHAKVLGNDIFGGIAWAVPEVSRERLEKYGFSVAVSGDGTYLAHELGHSMGLMHERSNDAGNEPFPYSHGYEYQHAPPKPDNPMERNPPRWHGTIMSSSPTWGGALLTFSNPDLEHPDEPGLRLGVPGDAPSSEPDGPADATRHLNELREVLVSVRSRAEADPCRYELIGDAGPLPSDGGIHSVRVETQAGCEWTANHGEWVSAVAQASGVGSGEIAYTVGPNDGFRRTVEIEVSGRLHTRPQAGSRPITPVCERSSSISHFLHESHPDYRFEADTRPGVIIVTHRTPCEELNFDADYLASLRNFRHPSPGRHYEGLQADNPQPGDFDGLSGLFELWLHSMERLPPDLFSGLTGLRLLELGQQRNPFDEQRLKEIAPGAFRGLTGLWKLNIHEHEVEVFERGMFEGMPRLRDMWVFGNILWLTSVPFGYYVRRESDGPSSRIAPGAFSELSNLRRLVFRGHRVEKLEADSFRGLRRLRSLFLGRDAIGSVDPGAFDGMPDLRILDVLDVDFDRLPPGVFDNLPNLTELVLAGSPSLRLPPGLFDRTRELTFLYLGHNSLRTPDAEIFSGLTKLQELWLQDNKLRSLPPGFFRDLESLELLVLRDNQLGSLRPGVFEGLDRLEFLRLQSAQVTSLEPGAFRGMPASVVLDLWNNRIREIAPETFRGLKLRSLFLDGNPGSPFTFAPTPMAPDPWTGAKGLPAHISINSVPVAPFRVDVELSATGGRLSSAQALIAAGAAQTTSEAQVTPDGEGPVTVRVDRVTAADVYYEGVRVAPGPPLVLYGFPDVALTAGRDGRSFDLAGVFGYFVGGDAHYGVSSSNSAVVAVGVEGGRLTLNPESTGTAEVTVTATGADGETMTRSFSVTVRVPSVPLFLAGSQPGREGFVRLINRSGRAGMVRVTAIDGEGARRGPVALRLGAHGAAHFNSSDLEDGNVDKGLPDGIGHGEGNWRLEFESELDILALSYVRTDDGFLTAMHDVAPTREGSHRIATFNPASNNAQMSRLRVFNDGLDPAGVTVRGVDDAGRSPGGAVRFSVPAGASREWTAVQLESGGAELEGALGDGEGKWRLAVETDGQIGVMSLLESRGTGHLTNLSSGPPAPDAEGVHHVLFLPSASDAAGRQGFVRVINRSNRAGTVRITAFDDAGAEHGPLQLSLGAGRAAHFNSDDLELGAADKGLSGSTGAGEGDWRLEITSGLEIGVLAYARTEDGFLTGLHEAVAVRDGRREVVTFNPASNTNQTSRLRLVNPTSELAHVGVVGTDDAGRLPGNTAWLRVPPRSALTISAAELEAGLTVEGWEGDRTFRALGDGVGKWRMNVSGNQAVKAMSLLESPTGHLTNLSSAPGIEAN